MNARRVGAVILAGMLLSACEGDSRLFEEAVEIGDLDLRSLTITPPAIEITGEIILNATQDLTLGVQGTSTAGTVVELSAEDRSWSSSNTDVIRVSNDGIVTGVGDGQAAVSVIIGGLQAEALPITVSTSPLESIDSLVALDGSLDLERCLPGEFFAIGQFGDQTLRPLSEATFTLNNSDDGRIDQTDEAIGVFSAFDLTPLSVSVSAGEAAPLQSQLTVLDTLTSVTVTGDTDVDEDDIIQLTATGAYTDPASGSTVATRSIDITEGVVWSIISGTDNASIDNTADSRGQLLGLLEGTAVAQAACGADQVAELTVTINEDSDSDELSFNLDRSDGLLLLSLSETFQLEVSQGDEFDEDELVTNDVQFTVVNTGSTTDTIDLSDIDDGLVTPLVEGAEADIFAVLFSDDGDDIIATGSITVRVTSF